ncbi:hypothetical protein HYFRA_00009596 [Hymenoscyphus fraxineus]|uniref:Uncharacterized protein n=1 Tax=Hymenoscyphus fraxineus TaxID=746836 RepID=A0A9N9PVI9_9HELO|nr:hypothetical protein HYFRA_00009596 [Hymenoscyphus fraxineus]
MLALNIFATVVALLPLVSGTPLPLNKGTPSIQSTENSASFNPDAISKRGNAIPFVAGNILGALGKSTAGSKTHFTLPHALGGVRKQKPPKTPKQPKQKNKAIKNN